MGKKLIFGSGLGLGILLTLGMLAGGLATGLLVKPIGLLVNRQFNNLQAAPNTWGLDIGQSCKVLLNGVPTGIITVHLSRSEQVSWTATDEDYILTFPDKSPFVNIAAATPNPIKRYDTLSSIDVTQSVKGLCSNNDGSSPACKFKYTLQGASDNCDDPVVVVQK